MDRSPTRVLLLQGGRGVAQVRHGVLEQADVAVDGVIGGECIWEVVLHIERELLCCLTQCALRSEWGARKRVEEGEGKEKTRLISLILISAYQHGPQQDFLCGRVANVQSELLLQCSHPRRQLAHLGGRAAATTSKIAIGAIGRLPA